MCVVWDQPKDQVVRGECFDSKGSQSTHRKVPEVSGEHYPCLRVNGSCEDMAVTGMIRHLSFKILRNFDAGIRKGQVHHVHTSLELGDIELRPIGQQISYGITGDSICPERTKQS